ncbi:LysR family transcriptional regulator [Roseateles oligotrophus]|uniref:LysR family transcriptional regulator n=1 Tax=Roseateles oligotrophus TaxID=1769250 RepID=UPI0021E4C4E0|nr:LysR family transcriptional regulator [Roseateles oligotrophus]
MQIFLGLAEAGSLSRAVALLSQSQPTLSRQLTALESSLGQSLFERHPRGLTLTAAGQALLPAARRMREGAQELSLALAARETSLAGTVRMTASEIVCCYFLPEFLARMRLDHPEIQLEIVASDEVENLLDRSADIALRMVRPEQGMLVARKLADWPLGMYAHRRYLARHGVPTVATLAQHHWLGFDRADQLLRGFAAAGFAVEREFFCLRSDSHVAMWEAMRAGCGIAVGLQSLAARDLNLQQVLPEIPIPPLPLWLTAHRELRDTPRLRLVFDALADWVGANP